MTSGNKPTSCTRLFLNDGSCTTVPVYLYVVQAADGVGTTRVSYNGTFMFAVFLLTEQMLEIAEKDP